MKQKKIPLRRCNGCNEMKPKKELVRVVRSPEGEVSLDLTGRKPGRGAYVCRSAKSSSRFSFRWRMVREEQMGIFPICKFHFRAIRAGDTPY